MRMRADKSARASYPRGVDLKGRRFAMSHQLALLEKAVAPWPRRQAPLLEVNCGNGAFLPFLWRSGFDVQGAEIDPSLRRHAQRAKVPGLEIFAASDTDLPFDNDSFDWVILHSKSADKNRLQQALEEGTRLARRGFMFTFWNSTSLPAITWRLLNKKSWMASSIAWNSAFQQMKNLGLGRLSTLSALMLPGCAWHAPWPGGACNIWGAPLGAWCIIRLDLGATMPATPLPLRIGSSLAPSQSPQVAMEYANKTSQPVKKP